MELSDINYSELDNDDKKLFSCIATLQIKVNMLKASKENNYREIVKLKNKMRVRLTEIGKSKEERCVPRRSVVTVQKRGE